MKEDIIKLYNTLCLIETKGESTKVMANCLVFCENLAKKADEYVKKEEKEDGE